MSLAVVGVPNTEKRSIFLTRPDYTHGKHHNLDHALIKQQIRGAFSEERLAKLTTPSRSAICPKYGCPPKGKLSILDLVTPGDEWAQDLRTLPDNPSEGDLLKVINPYLQLVRSEARDTISGQKLIDIWRYFRYLWAIPYQTTPGRNLFYLVRDAARPTHPVIGIAALGNCVVQLSERDQVIGWSVEAVEKTLQRRHRIETRDLPKESPVRRGSEIVFLETEREYAKRIRNYSATLAGFAHSGSGSRTDSDQPGRVGNGERMPQSHRHSGSSPARRSKRIRT